MLEAIANYSPHSIIGFIFGIPLYWYGLFYMISIIIGYLLVDTILKKINSEASSKLREILPKVTFWVFIWGIIGARLYHVLNEWQFYADYPQLIWRIDNGGLAIHGALIGGALYLSYLARKLNVKFLWLTDLITPALLLGQAIGRWGNYFNQELYGQPTNLPWGIFIAPKNRLSGFENFTHFHPTFFYEFAWDLVGVILLVFIVRKILNPTDSKHVTLGSGIVTAIYLIVASAGRIFVEVFRIDVTPNIFGFRLPFLIAVLLLCIGIIYIATIFTKRNV